MPPYLWISYKAVIKVVGGVGRPLLVALVLEQLYSTYIGREVWEDSEKML